MKHLKLFEQFDDPFGEEDIDSHKYNFIKYPTNVIWYKENYGEYSIYQEFELEKDIKKLEKKIQENPSRPDWITILTKTLNIFLERLELLRSFKKN